MEGPGGVRLSRNQDAGHHRIWDVLPYKNQDAGHHRIWDVLPYKR